VLSGEVCLARGSADLTSIVADRDIRARIRRGHRGLRRRRSPRVADSARGVRRNHHPICLRRGAIGWAEVGLDPGQRPLRATGRADGGQWACNTGHHRRPLVPGLRSVPVASRGSVRASPSLAPGEDALIGPVVSQRQGEAKPRVKRRGLLCTEGAGKPDNATNIWHVAVRADPTVRL
jgi:hypothetical protein